MAAAAALVGALVLTGRLLGTGDLDGFVVPPDATGVPGRLGALAVLATRQRATATGPGFWCPDQRPVATPTVHGRPAVLGICPAGFLGWSADSVLLRWSEGGRS